jgi:cell wall-associated NlpC family hydrolase
VIAETGLLKLVAAGGGLVCGVVVFTGAAAGAHQVTADSAAHSTVCEYAHADTTPHPVSDGRERPRRAATASQDQASLGHVAAGLSAHEAATVTAEIHGGAAVEASADAVIASVARRLPAQTRTSQHAAMATARQLVASIAQDLCVHLDARAGLFPDDLVALPVTASRRAATAVRAAMAMRGTPYSWGGGGAAGPGYGIGHGAHIKGFDCSGLTEYAWAQAGLRIGGHTSTQWHAGARIPRAHIQPGDLVFFAANPDDPSTIHHVGLAVDPARMIHAPFTGSTVRIDTWADTPSREREYAGAIRPQ